MALARLRGGVIQLLSLSSDERLTDADLYLLKTIITLGVYQGGRAARDPTIELPFDTEVTHRHGFGTALAPHGDVYVGRCGTAASGFALLRGAVGRLAVGYRRHIRVS